MTPAELSRELESAFRASAPRHKTTTVHLFGIRHVDSIRECGASIASIIRNAGLPASYATELHKGMALAKWVGEHGRSPDPDEPAACGTCAFWISRDTRPGTGQCRRYAPQPVMSRGQPETAVWPVTSHSEWCGSWLRRARTSRV